MIIIVMGVSGCGKSTVAEALARRIGGEFLDADGYHPRANVEKMRRGEPLDDEDRAGWLSRLAGELEGRLGSSRPTVLACSALKEAYRQRLRVGPEVRFLYLKGSPDLIRRRLEARQGHFMKAGLLDSQFAALEEPAGDDVLTVGVEQPVEALVDRAAGAWARRA